MLFSGVDIFHMMNLSVPSNISSLEGWAILIYPNSAQYKTLQAAFGVCTVRFKVYLHYDAQCMALLIQQSTTWIKCLLSHITHSSYIV